MPTLPDWAIQVLQVVTILTLAPLVSGIIARVEAIIQQRRGPRVLQPYYDILKLLRKETVLPAPAGPLFRAAPYVSFAAYATVPLLVHATKQILDNWGDDGWELVALVPGPNQEQLVAYMKRAKGTS